MAKNMSEIIQIISDIFSIISLVFSIYSGNFFTTRKKYFFRVKCIFSELFSRLFSAKPVFVRTGLTSLWYKKSGTRVSKFTSSPILCYESDRVIRLFVLTLLIA